MIALNVIYVARTFFYDFSIFKLHSNSFDWSIPTSCEIKNDDSIF